jgi:hypothetical protein
MPQCQSLTLGVYRTQAIVTIGLVIMIQTLLLRSLRAIAGVRLFNIRFTLAGAITLQSYGHNWPRTIVFLRA